VIIVSGPPASGKTTIAQRIAEELDWPFVYKDGVKERLFDLIHCAEHTQVTNLEQTSLAVLYYFVEVELRAGKPLVVESNFKPKFEAETFQALQKQYGFYAIQVRCWADHGVLVERFRERAESEDRHPAHGDLGNVDDFEASLENGEYGLMDLGGSELPVDMTDFEQIDYPALFADLRRAVEAGG
jgi:predicted kinase